MHEYQRTVRTGDPANAEHCKGATVAQGRPSHHDLDGSRNHDGQGLAEADRSSAGGVASAVPRTAPREATLRPVRRRQSHTCPVIVPADQFYARRKATADHSNYWGTSVDPDGKMRNRIGSESERQQHLEDRIDELAMFATWQPGSILDVGCGLGWFLSALPDAWQRYGLEICSEAQRIAAKVCNLVAWPLPSLEGDQFDVVRCCHVIEHMPDPELDMLHMVRVLKPGGMFVIETPDFGSPCAVRFGDHFRLLHDPTHCSLFTTESLLRMVRHFGITVEAVEYPFPKRFATAETWQRWDDTSTVSPPWPGNVVRVIGSKAK